MTPPEHRETLLRIARDAIVAHVIGAQAQASGAEGLASVRGGVFVTVYCRGELRGCIGHMAPDSPIANAVAACARSAASADPRFSPIAVNELDDVDIELSLLGPLEAVSGPVEVEVGRHGVVVEQRGRRGLLLPQVAIEWQWNAEMFVARTCQKAGLPHDAWKNGATIYRFEAEVFR